MSHARYGDFVLLSDDRCGHVGSQSPQAVQLRMGFRGAERYALGLGVFAAFSGKAAPEHIQIRRAFRNITFDTCNDNGWSLGYSKLKINTGKRLQ